MDLSNAMFPRFLAQSKNALIPICQHEADFFADPGTTAAGHASPDEMVRAAVASPRRGVGHPYFFRVLTRQTLMSVAPPSPGDSCGACQYKKRGELAYTQRQGNWCMFDATSDSVADEQGRIAGTMMSGELSPSQRQYLESLLTTADRRAISNYARRVQLSAACTEMARKLKCQHRRELQELKERQRAELAEHKADTPHKDWPDKRQSIMQRQKQQQMELKQLQAATLRDRKSALRSDQRH